MGAGAANIQTLLWWAARPLFPAQIRNISWAQLASEDVWLQKKKKKNQIRLQFYSPLSFAILKKHTVLDFWPATHFFSFGCFYFLQLICPNQQEIHHLQHSEVQTCPHSCSGCVFWGGNGLLSLLSITAGDATLANPSSCGVLWKNNTPENILAAKNLKKVLR